MIFSSAINTGIRLFVALVAMACWSNAFANESLAQYQPDKPNLTAVPAKSNGTGPATLITCGTVIDQPGHYRLDQHLVCSEIGIEIVADDVKLDFAGYSMTCDQTGRAWGVFVRDVQGAKIFRGTISNCTLGIFLYGSSKSMVSRMHLTGNDFDNPDDASGLLLNSANDNLISRNVITHNGQGISLFDSSGNSIVGNDSSDNRYDGLRLLPLSPMGGSNDNTIVENTFNRNDDTLEFFSSGVQWSGPSTGNVFSRNTLNDNGLAGVFLYGQVEWGWPMPTGNSIKGNTALGNIILDLAEYDLSIEAPPESCNNNWSNNTFGSAFAPEMCIE